MSSLPLLVEPQQLHEYLGSPGLLVVDLSRAEIHAQYHIPGAVPVEYAEIVRMQPPVGGLLPEAEQLSRILSRIGLTPQTHVVAYDDEGGGKACRLLWTLEAIGHTRYSLLDGGLHAWANEGHPLTDVVTAASASDYQARYLPHSSAVADSAYILAHLDDPAVALLDARSEEEYRGSKRFAARGGHIPGAVNLEWTRFMDPTRNLRLKTQDELRALLCTAGISDQPTVVAYCQTHHRSAHTWFVLKWLGYDAKGYAGSWSDWGNRTDLPVSA